MNKKLYVGNLNYETTESELQTLFVDAGAVVSVAIIIDRASGRSKGFGFVEMETEEAAQTAIERFNSYEFKGRTLTVNEARPPRERSFGGGGRRGGGGGRGDWSRDGGDRRY